MVTLFGLRMGDAHRPVGVSFVSAIMIRSEGKANVIPVLSVMEY